MIDKPLKDMDEAELKFVLAKASAEIEHCKSALRGYSHAISTKQRVMAQLRDRFGVDCKTGKRLGRKGRGLFGMTG